VEKVWQKIILFNTFLEKVWQKILFKKVWQKKTMSKTILYTFFVIIVKKYGKEQKKQYKGNFINQYIFVFLYYQIPTKKQTKQ